MKIFYCASIALLMHFSINAQTNAAADTSNQHIPSNGSAVLEKESGFRGGNAGWISFLRSNLNYPAKARRKNIEGTVTVQFIVNADGTLSDIKAVDGPELLLEAAVDVIKKSPNWIPAFQHGKKVKSYKKQPITFKLS